MKKRAQLAKDIPHRVQKSVYPEEFAKKVAGREKRQLGNFFGLTKYGVNFVELAPHSMSALLHRHSHQEEFVYILKGHPTLVTDEGEERLSPGMCVGFRPQAEAHQIVNRTDEPVEYLEVGDREAQDSAEYPQDDLVARFEQGRYIFTRKNGSSY